MDGFDGPPPPSGPAALGERRPASVNGADARRPAHYDGRVKALLALVAACFLIAAAPFAAGPIRLCPGAEPGPDCAPADPDAGARADITAIRLSGPGATLVRTVAVDPGALPLSRPLQVSIVAMASAEVRWNGVVIGRNGVPGPDPASERPGRFISSFVVPDRLVRPGDNLLEVRMSAQHLWLPVRRPIHMIEVGPYETPALPGLADYLPALLVLGALAAAFVYFGAAVLSDRSDRSARLLASIAATAVLQLAAEVSRTFIAYSYPWHIARVSAIALLAAVTAILIAAYASNRFAPARRRPIVAAAALAAAASVTLVPWYDLKALGAILAGALALAAAAMLGLRTRLPFAGTALAFAALLALLMAWQRTGFLDQAYYLYLAALLVLLVAEQVSSLRRARSERDSERRRSAALAERLARAEREGEAIVALKDGGRTHRVAEGDILSIRAADDYCDVLLADGRSLLVTTTLARLLAALPGRFVRVHKSHAVNRPHVTAMEPRPGGGKLLKLSDGSEIPV